MPELPESPAPVPPEPAPVRVPTPELPESPSPVPAPENQPQQLKPAPHPPQSLLDLVIRTYLGHVNQSIEENELYVPELHVAFNQVRGSLTVFAEDNDIRCHPDDEVSTFHARSIDDYLEDLDAMLEERFPTPSRTLNNLVETFRADILHIRGCIQDPSLKSIVQGLTHNVNVAMWSSQMEDMYRLRNDSREHWFRFVLTQVRPLKESLFQLCDSLTQLHWTHL